MSLKDIYQERLLEHYQNSPHRGVLEHATCSSGVYNPSCGDAVSLQVIIQNDIIIQAKFEAKGCVISVAATSLLLDGLVGLSCVDAQKISADDLKKMIGIPLGPTRLRCALLPLDALQNILQDYRKKSCVK